MKSYYLLCILVLIIAAKANANDFPLDKVVDACMKDKNLQVCRDLGLVKDNAERKINQQLAYLGLTNFAIITGTLMQYAYTGKMEFKMNSGDMSFLGKERSIAIQNNAVFIQLTWPLE